MKKAIRAVVLTVAAITYMLSNTTGSVQARPYTSTTSSVTEFQVYNGSNENTTAAITVPADGACGSVNISDLVVSDVSTGAIVTVSPLGSSALQGFFTLNRGQTVQIKRRLNPGNCIAGLNVSFLAPPQCPCAVAGGLPDCSGFVNFVPGPAQVNGVNQAEVTLNVTPPAQEACNISCNTGANATINMTSSGGPQWITPIVEPSFNITNSWVDFVGKRDNNCNIPGVFGYQLTTCTGGAKACITDGPYCTQTSDNCVFQRVAVNGHFGGVVKATFMGPLAPPAP